MALSVPPKTDAPTVTCTIDGVEVTVPSGTTIYTAAKQAGIDIPVLCHDERYDPVGVCRMCVVDVGGRVLAAACVRPCEDGMEVTTASAKVEKQRAVLTELLMADQPDEDPKETTTGDNLLLELARRYDTGHAERLPQARGRGDRRLEPGDQRQPRRVHPVRPLRPRLRRHPGQRRDRPHRQGLRRRGSRSTSTTRWASRRA